MTIQQPNQASQHPTDLSRRLIIVGCSAEKTPTDQALPAMDLYDGGCVPPLRARLGHLPDRRAHVRFLSAQHGLVTADTPLRTYDRALDPVRAHELRHVVAQQLQTEFAAKGVPDSILLVAEPLYLVLIADLFAMPERPRVHWIPDHAHGWPQAATILDEWGW
jgi:hypothetical protein